MFRSFLAWSFLACNSTPGTIMPGSVDDLEAYNLNTKYLFLIGTKSILPNLIGWVGCVDEDGGRSLARLSLCHESTYTTTEQSQVMKVP